VTNQGEEIPKIGDLSWTVVFPEGKILPNWERGGEKPRNTRQRRKSIEGKGKINGPSFILHSLHKRKRSSAFVCERRRGGHRAGKEGGIGQTLVSAGKKSKKQFSPLYHRDGEKQIGLRIIPEKRKGRGGEIDDPPEGGETTLMYTEH